MVGREFFVVSLELPATLLYIGCLVKITGGLSEGQVLQRLGTRGADVLISGECKQDGPVTVTISQGGKPLKGWEARPVGKSSKGRFTVKLAGLPAGGPYKLTLVVGPQTTSIKSFYVGDVWLMSGQSNMQGVGNMEGAGKPHRLIRVFTMRRDWREAADPLHVLGESPDIVHNNGLQYSAKRSEEYRKTTIKGVGVGLFFARKLLEKTGVPQGLIATAHGGTSMAQWNPELRKEGGASLYYSMAESLRATGQPVAGVLWYQGESDMNEAAAGVYVDAMKRLVAAVRKDLRTPLLPWVIVQLGRSPRPGDGKWWNAIQEHQRLLPRVVKNLETVPAIDLPLDDHVHIGSDGFVVLGERMAEAAARLALGDRKAMQLPQLRKIHPIARDQYGWYLEVEFDGVKGSLTAVGEPRGFAFVDVEHRPQPSIYRISLRGNIARLHLINDTLQGLKLGYGLGPDPVCNIVDERGVSLPVFGPQNFQRSRAVLPYVTKWRKTALLPVVKPLNRLACRPVKDAVKSYDAGGFINEFEDWKGKPGQVFFSSVLTLSEPMKLRFLMGYDGPFRLWVDGKVFFQDINGTNPCIADASTKVGSLRRGKHVVTIAMDTNEGNAWGFFLRFERLDVTARERQDGSYAQPEYSA